MENALLTQLVALSTAIAGGVQMFIVPQLDSILTDAGFAERSRSIVYAMFRVLIAILVVLTRGDAMNIFTDLGGGITWTNVVGLIVTGFLVGLGSEVLTWVYAIAHLRFEVFKAESQLRIASANAEMYKVK